MATAFDSLSAEHHELDAIYDMDRPSKTLRGEPTDSGAFDALHQQFGSFRDHVLAHLNNEEPIFFPLLDKFRPDDETELLGRRMVVRVRRARASPG